MLQLAAHKCRLTPFSHHVTCYPQRGACCMACCDMTRHDMLWYATVHAKASRSIVAPQTQAACRCIRGMFCLIILRRRPPLRAPARSSCAWHISGSLENRRSSGSWVEDRGCTAWVSGSGLGVWVAVPLWRVFCEGSDTLDTPTVVEGSVFQQASGSASRSANLESGDWLRVDLGRPLPERSRLVAPPGGSSSQGRPHRSPRGLPGFETGPTRTFEDPSASDIRSSYLSPWLPKIRTNTSVCLLPLCSTRTHPSPGTCIHTSVFVFVCTYDANVWPYIVILNHMFSYVPVLHAVYTHGCVCACANSCNTTPCVACHTTLVVVRFARDLVARKGITP